jgi:filamentous hemagglutinin
VSGGTANVTAGQNVTLGDVSAGNLTLSATNGSVTDAGNVAVLNGNATVTAGQNVSLATVNVSGLANVTAGQNVALGDVNAGNLTLSATNGSVADTGSATVLNGDATITAAQNVSLSNVTVGSATRAGNLTVAAMSGQVTGSGTWNVGGRTNVTAGKNATLGNLSSGNLTVTSTGGDVTDTKLVNVTGTTTLAAANGSITVNGANNMLGTVSATANYSAGTVTLTSGAGLTLANVSANNALLTAGGAISEVPTGMLNVNSGATLAAEGNVNLLNLSAGNINVTSAYGNITDTQGEISVRSKTILSAVNGTISWAAKNAFVVTPGAITASHTLVAAQLGSVFLQVSAAQLYGKTVLGYMSSAPLTLLPLSFQVSEQAGPVVFDGSQSGFTLDDIANGSVALNVSSN